MKKTKNFNISVPELGDKPDITQVSNAIQDLEDALAGTLEVMTASIQGSALTLTSGARTTKRTQYYDGMAIKFVAPIQINPNSLTTAKVDNLTPQTLEIPYLVNAGDSVDIIYKTNKFVGTISAVQRSNAVNSSSTTTVGTSLAVKTAYDKGVEALNKANAAQSTADSKVSKAGDTMTGELIAQGGINTVGLKVRRNGNLLDTDDILKISVDDSDVSYKIDNSTDGGSGDHIFQNVNTDGSVRNCMTIKSNGVIFANDNNRVYHQGFKPTKADVGLGNVENWSVTSSVSDPSNAKYATAGAVKQAYDKGVEALSSATNANSNANGRVPFYPSIGDVRPGFYYGHISSSNTIGAPTSGSQAFILKGETDTGYQGALVFGYDAGVFSLGQKRLNESWSWRRIYHQGFKPTKDDVGLSNVNNWGATTAVNSTSTTTYATASAVKQAYDKAVEANNNISKFCPYRVGDILTTTLPENPAATWVGTTWTKIEGRYLKGTSGSEASKQTGGSMTKTLSVANMPAHNHSASQSAHTHTQPAHTHNITRPTRQGGTGGSASKDCGWSSDTGLTRTDTFTTVGAGGDNTGSAQPAITIGNTGSGTAFDIQPSYYTVHYWLRTA